MIIILRSWFPKTLNHLNLFVWSSKGLMVHPDGAYERINSSGIIYLAYFIFIDKLKKFIRHFFITMHTEIDFPNIT